MIATRIKYELQPKSQSDQMATCRFYLETADRADIDLVFTEKLEGLHRRCFIKRYDSHVSVSLGRHVVYAEVEGDVRFLRSMAESVEKENIFAGGSIPLNEETACLEKTPRTLGIRTTRSCLLEIQMITLDEPGIIGAVSRAVLASGGSWISMSANVVEGSPQGPSLHLDGTIEYPSESKAMGALGAFRLLKLNYEHFHCEVLRSVHDEMLIKSEDDSSDLPRPRVVSRQVDTRRAAINRLRDGIRRMNFRSSGTYPTRDELHDRA